MNIIDRLVEFFKDIKKENKTKTLVEQVKDNNETVDEYVDDVVAKIKENPGIEKTFLKKIAEDKEIPDNVIPKTATELIQDDEIGKNATLAGVEIVTEIGNQLQDSTLKKVADIAAESPDVDVSYEIKIAEQIEDKRKRQIKAEEILNRIYLEDMKNKGDNSVVKEIEQTQFVEDSERMKQLTKNIIAKKIALDTHQYGSTLLFNFSKIIKPSDMINENIIDIVGNEYCKIKEESKYGNLRKEQLKKLMLQEVIKQEILDGHEDGDKFTVPEMSKLSDEEIEYLVFELQSLNKDKSRNRLSSKDINSVIQQVKGIDQNDLKERKNIGMEPGDD